MGARPVCRFAKAYFLVRQPLVPVQQVDDAAVAEAMFLEDVLHDAVVAVGVRPQVGQLGVAPVEAGSRHAPGIFSSGQAVDGAVGLHVVQPLPVVDAGIRGVTAHDEGKGTHGAAVFVQTEVAIAPGDVLLHDFFGGIAFGPLVHVAVAAHDAPTAVIQVHQGGEVGEGGFSDLYHGCNRLGYEKWMACRVIHFID